MSISRKGVSKAVYAAVLAVTMITMVFAGVVPSVSAAQRHMNGSVVVSGGTAYLVQNDTLRPFPTPGSYLSNGYAWTSLQTATDGDLALARGPVMDWGDGALVNDGGTAYMVNQGKKYAYGNAAAYLGHGFKFSSLYSGSTSNFTYSGAITSASQAHPAGTILISGSTLWWVRDTGRAAFPTWASYISYGFKNGGWVQANAADLALPVLANVVDRVNGSTSLIDSGSTGQQTQAGPISVSLASNTPAMGIVVGSAARVPFTTVNLINNNSYPVTVDTLTVQRGGVAQDGSISSVVLIDPATNNLLDTQKTLNSSHQATFTKDILLNANSSKPVIIAANIAARATLATSYAGENPTLGVVAISMVGGAAVSGLPVYGNPQNVNATIAIGTVTATNDTSAQGSGNIAVGTTGTVFTAVKLAAATEDVQVSQITFYNNGTSADGDVTNLKLQLDDGTILATASGTTNKYVTFNFSPITILKGNNKTFSVLADVASGSARTIVFEVEKPGYDILAKGMTYGYNIVPNVGSEETALAGTSRTISTGSVAVAAASGFVAANIAAGGSNQAIGAFDFTVKGEPVTVSKLGIQIATTTASVLLSDVTSITLKDPNGVTVAGPMDPSRVTDTTMGATSTDSFTVPVGVYKYTVYATLSNNVGNNATLQAMVTPATFTVKGNVTNNTIAPTPATQVSSAVMTVKTGGLTASLLSTPGAQSVVKGSQNFTFANLVLDTSASAEDVRVTQLKFAVHTASAAAPADVSGFKLMNGSTQIAVSNNPDPTDSVATDSATTTFTFASPLILAKNTQTTLSVTGNISASAGTGTYQVGIQSGTPISATGVSTGTTVTPSISYSDGSAMNFVAKGTLNLASDPSSPVAGLLAGGKTDQTVAVLSAQAINEATNLEKLYMTATAVNSGGWDQVAALKIYDGSTLVKTVVPTTTDAASATVLVDMTGSPIQIAAGSTKLLTIKVDTSLVNDTYNGAKGGEGQGFSLSINATGDVTAHGASSGQASTISGTPSFNQFVLYKSVPTFVRNQVDSTLLANGTKDLFKFTVSADSAGAIGLAKFTFAVATTGVNVTNFQVVEVNGSTETVLNATPVAAGVDWNGNGGSTDAVAIYVDSPYYRQVPAGGSRTYVLRGDVTNASSGDQISVNLLGDNAFPGTYPNNLVTLNGANLAVQSATGQTGFLWSDLVHGATSTTAATNVSTGGDNVWTNGYKVNGLTATTSAQVISMN